MAIQLGSFPGTFINTATDIRQELSDLDTLCSRSSPETAKQIENSIEDLLIVLSLNVAGVPIVTPPDATVPSTVQLRALYPAFNVFSRVQRIKIQRALSLGTTSDAVLLAIADQLTHFLTSRGWTIV